MAKVATGLTDTKVRNAKAKDKPYNLYDGNGLRLQITKNSKRWYFDYKFNNSKKSMALAKINDYPTISIKTARELRQELRQALANGTDPSIIKDGHIITFGDVFYEWCEKFNNNLAPKSKNRKIAEVKSYALIRLNISVDIKALTKKDFIRVLELRNQEAPSRVSRLQGYLKEILAYATQQEYIESNFINDIKLEHLFNPHKTTNHKAVIQEADFTNLVKVIYSLDNPSSVNNALKFLLHLPLRCENLVTMRWQYIDLKNKLLSIPRAQMKTDKRDNEFFQLPLSDEVIQILQVQRKYHNGDFVFPSDKDTSKTITNGGLNSALARLGFIGELKQTTHSFRACFSTLANANLDEIQTNNAKAGIERILDHRTGSAVELIYNRAKYDEAKRIVAQWWSEFILKLKG